MLINDRIESKWEKKRLNSSRVLGEASCEEVCNAGDYEQWACNRSVCVCADRRRVDNTTNKFDIVKIVVVTR